MIIIQQIGDQYSWAQGSVDVVFTPCAVIENGVIKRRSIPDDDPELDKFFDDERQYKFDHIDDYEKVGIDVSKLREAKERALKGK